MRRAIRFRCIPLVLFFAASSTQAVRAQDYSMSIDAPASVARGDSFTVTLRGTAAATPALGLLGVSAQFTYDPALVSVDSLTFVGTVWEGSDFLSVIDDLSGTIRVGVVRDQDGSAPPANATVAAGVDLPFLLVGLTASQCTGTASFGFSGTINDNLLVDENIAGHDTGNGLVLTGDNVDIQAIGTFVRGNAQNDAVDVSNPSFSVGLADGIFILQGLFQGGAAPSCEDSADANDDGRINIIDAIQIFQFLIGNQGPTLPAPFTSLGTDPSGDGLGCATPPSAIGC